MLDPKVEAAASDLGRKLALVPAIASFRAAEAALNRDANAQLILNHLREQQELLGRLQRSGLTPSQEQIDALRVSQSAVRADPTIMEFLRATNEAKALLPGVGLRIGGTLGLDFGRLASSGSC
ncbi:MAG: YlbF family regulator [Candidatus Limnocylindrales bacterium]